MPEIAPPTILITSAQRVVLPFAQLCTVFLMKGSMNLARSTASRKYQITINNPTEHGFSHDRIKMMLQNWETVLYWCMCDEIGEQGTHHTHIYVAFANPVMFSTIQKRFYGAHIEAARGTHSENRSYIRKDGKWEDDAKHETNLPDSFEESGELPPDRAEKQKQSDAVYAMVKGGASNAEILEAYPSTMNQLPHIERTRQTLLSERYKNEFRQLHVVYLHGEPGTGKTRSVMETHGYENVYRVTNYQHPFDGYKGQEVIVFDEFRSGLPISEMLNYLDGYPCDLPSRYTDKAACYLRVYIISNIPLKQQYPQIQLEQPKTWKAFLRRIHEVYEMLPDDAETPFD